MTAPITSQQLRELAEEFNPHFPVNLQHPIVPMLYAAAALIDSLTKERDFHKEQHQRQLIRADDKRRIALQAEEKRYEAEARTKAMAVKLNALQDYVYQADDSPPMRELLDMLNKDRP